MTDSSQKPRTVAFFPAYNEAGKIGGAVSRVPTDAVSGILVIDDGSSDKTGEEARRAGAHVIRKNKREGVGSAIRDAVRYAEKEGFEAIVILAGNGKDDGEEIPRLTDAMCEEGFDFVQGSRFLNGGKHAGMPLHRVIATRYIHPALFRFFSGRRVTDTTNGFRAIRIAMLKDKRINLNQKWLDHYELEPYLLYKAVQLGYRVAEVAVSKIYPDKGRGYTKMKPFVDWWSILKPLFLLGLRIKQ